MNEIPHLNDAELKREFGSLSANPFFRHQLKKDFPEGSKPRIVPFERCYPHKRFVACCWEFCENEATSYNSFGQGFCLSHYDFAAEEDYCDD